MRALWRHLVVITLAAAGLWLSHLSPLEWDLSVDSRHTLSATSRQVLERLEGPVEITAFISDDADMRRAVSALIGMYEHHYPDIKLAFVDLGESLDEVRELGIPASGAVRVVHNDGSELLLRLGETELTGALQRLLMRKDQWVVAVTGHGERRLDGDANHDLRDFAAALKRDGFQLHSVDLPGAAAIPENTAVLVIADPRAPFLIGEKALIADYLANGGNLLWLADPDPSGSTDWLEEQLPVNRLTGTVVDARGARLGFEDPRLVAAASDGSHPVTAHLQTLILLPHAAALAPRAAADDWTVTTLLSSSAASWNETAEVRGEVSRDAEAGESLGPLPLAVAMERDAQRVVVAGDSDLFSNAYLGNGGNLNLGLAMMRWLTVNDELIDIPAPIAPDARLALSPNATAGLAGTFLVGLPIAFLVAGFTISYARRRR